MQPESVEKKSPKGFHFREMNILIALILMCLLITIMNPRFLNPFNLQTIARQVAIYGLLAVGETLVIITGGIDLSVGSLVALIGVLVALLMKSGIAVPLAIIVVLLISSLIGLTHGLFVTKLNVPPFIITLELLPLQEGWHRQLRRDGQLSAFLRASFYRTGVYYRHSLPPYNSLNFCCYCFLYHKIYSFGKTALCYGRKY